MAKQTTTAAPARTASRPVETARGKTPSILAFVQESRAELRKVTWPTREQTLNLTAAVIAMSVFVAAFLGIVDYLLNAIITPLLP
ncbi:MAG: preprotein translocase subunit SecE [Chloroflexota bacterium]